MPMLQTRRALLLSRLNLTEEEVCRYAPDHRIVHHNLRVLLGYLYN